MNFIQLKQQFLSGPNKRLFLIFSTVILILCIPLIAMQFTEAVQWNIFDFIVAAILLAGTGLILELILRKISRPKSKTLFVLLLLVALLLTWAELAVGIFGTPFAGS